MKANDLYHRMLSYTRLLHAIYYVNDTDTRNIIITVTNLETKHLLKQVH